MEIKNELKEYNIKNCTCYFDDIIKAIDINFNNILLDKKLYRENYEKCLIYDISKKNLNGWKTIVY